MFPSTPLSAPLSGSPSAVRQVYEARRSFVTTEELDIYDSTLQHVYGDDWQVVSVDRRIPSGSEVKVVNVNGTKLEVQTVES